MVHAPTLRGSLDDLPVDDVVRLLATNRTSGVLTISPNAPIRLVFADGALLVGSAGSAMALGRYALAAGLVTAERLEELFGLVRTRLGERQAQALDEVEVLEALAAHVGPEALAAAARIQSVAAITEAALLTAAHWQVEETPPHRLAGLVAVPADEVLTTAIDQLRSWQAHSDAVGGDPGRLRRVLRLAPGTPPVELGALEWAALVEVDAQATVGQLAHRLGIGRHDAYVLAGDLAARGLVELLG